MLAHDIGHILRGCSRYYDALLDDHTDRTRTQLIVMRAIAELPGASQRSIVEATGIDRSTLSVLLKTLHDAGLVFRRMQDGKSHALELTSAGKWHLRHDEAAARHASRAFFKRIPDGDRRRVLSALQPLAMVAGKRKDR